MKIIHVSVQDPNHATGGQGISTLNLCKTYLKLGYEIEYISLRLKGELVDQTYIYPEGQFNVHRISVSDSDYIETPYSGKESQQLGRREEFYHSVTKFILSKYNPSDIFVHLYGFFFEPIISGALPNYNIISTYNLLITERMKHTGENHDLMYDFVRSMEILSLYANKKIRALCPGIKNELLMVASDINNPFYKEYCKRLAVNLNITTIGMDMACKNNSNLNKRIYVIPHGVGEEFFSVPTMPVTTNRVIAIGRISQEKGFEYLIEAARYLPNLNFLIGGTTGDSERKRFKYRQLLEQKGSFINNLSFDLRPKGIRGEELIRLIDSAEIIVMPSLYEPFGLLNVEALARGKPVITTTTTGGTYIMNSKIPCKLPYGYIIPLDKNTMSENINNCLVNFFSKTKIEKKLMSDKAKKRASYFRWKTVAQQMVDLFKQ